MLKNEHCIARSLTAQRIYIHRYQAFVFPYRPPSEIWGYLKRITGIWGNRYRSIVCEPVAYASNMVEEAEYYPNIREQ